jgi:hypothetical protein
MLMRFLGEFGRAAAVVALLTAGWALACAQEAKVVVTMPPVPLLPQTVGPAAAKLSTDTVTRVKAADLIASDLDAGTCLPGKVAAAVSDPVDCIAVLKEDGLLRVASAKYTHSSGPGTVLVAAFEFDDATGAYSAYTFYRSRMTSVKVSSSDIKALVSASETSTDSAGTLVWAGTAVLRVAGKLSPAEVTQLISSLPKVGGRKALPPLLPTFFPTEGLDRGGIRYALGPAGYQAMHGVLPPAVVDWSRSTEAATAAYAGRNGKGNLTLLMSPTPQIAGAQGRAIEKTLNDLPPVERTARFGTIKLRRVGPMVGLATGGLGAERAEALVQALHLSEEVTFDKPMPLEFHAEVKKTASLLENIAAFVGVLMLAAILLAVFLGGARAGIRVLQGKPAATEPEFLTINLRGQAKPLRSPEPTAAEPAARPPDQ